MAFFLEVGVSLLISVRLRLTFPTPAKEVEADGIERLFHSITHPFFCSANTQCPPNVDPASKSLRGRSTGQLTLLRRGRASWSAQSLCWSWREGWSWREKREGEGNSGSGAGHIEPRRSLACWELQELGSVSSGAEGWEWGDRKGLGTSRGGLGAPTEARW